MLTDPMLVAAALAAAVGGATALAGPCGMSMVETITPVVNGGRMRWMIAVGAHTVGAATSAALFGAILGVLGGMLGAPWGPVGPALVAVIAAAYAVSEITGRALPVPQARRQVPEWWRTFFGPIATAGLYGAGLGIGFLTYVRGGALVAVTAFALVSDRPGAGAAVLAAFGIARGATLIVVARTRTSEDVAQVADRVAAVISSRLPRVVTAVVLIALAAAAASAAVDARGLQVAPAALAVVALAMGWAAIAKLARPKRWRSAVRAYGLGRLESVAAFAVPVAEIAVLVLALAHQRRAAAALCLSMLVCFSAAAVRARMRSGAPLPCGCFGGDRTRSLRAILARNAAIGTLAAIALTGSADRAWLAPALRSSEIVPVALLAAGVTAVIALAVRVRTISQGIG